MNSLNFAINTLPLKRIVANLGNVCVGKSLVAGSGGYISGAERNGKPFCT